MGSHYPQQLDVPLHLSKYHDGAPFNYVPIRRDDLVSTPNQHGVFHVKSQAFVNAIYNSQLVKQNPSGFIRFHLCEKGRRGKEDSKSSFLLIASREAEWKFAELPKSLKIDPEVHYLLVKGLHSEHGLRSGSDYADWDSMRSFSSSSIPSIESTPLPVSMPELEPPSGSASESESKSQLHRSSNPTPAVSEPPKIKRKARFQTPPKSDPEWESESEVDILPPSPVDGFSSVEPEDINRKAIEHFQAMREFNACMGFLDRKVLSPSPGQPLPTINALGGSVFFQGLVKSIPTKEEDYHSKVQGVKSVNLTFPQLALHQYGPREYPTFDTLLMWRSVGLRWMKLTNEEQAILARRSLQAEDPHLLNEVLKWLVPE